MVFGAARGLGIGSVQSSEEEGKVLAWRHEPWLLIIFLLWLCPLKRPLLVWGSDGPGGPLRFLLLSNRTVSHLPAQGFPATGVSFPTSSKG